METKLKNAADLLPKPHLEVEAIITKGSQNQKARKPSRRIFRIVLAAVLVLCLTTTVYAYGKINYGLWSQLSSTAFADVSILSWTYDYTIPEKLSGIPFVRMSTYYAAPQGATHLEALLSPTYVLHSVYYGSGVEEVLEDGTILFSGEQISISFGTTEKAQWKYHFSVAEDGSCNYEGVDPDSQQTVEYEGYTLYMYTAGGIYSVRWEDTQRKLVIVISSSWLESQEDIAEIAKELISLNI